MVDKERGGMAGLLLCAFVLYGLVFHAAGLWFWGGLAATAALLALGAALVAPDMPGRACPRGAAGWFWALAGGMAGAAALYAVFVAGGWCSARIVPGGARSIQSIYARGAGVSPALIVPVLAAVAVCEELFWRGLLQPALCKRTGRLFGWAATAALYAAVHIAAGNFVLFGAAGVAGLAFGLIALLRPGLPGVIVMHLVFDILSFVVLPIDIR